MSDLSIQSIQNFKTMKSDETGHLSEQLKRDIELRKKTEELEGLFITQLFKSMEKTIHKDSDSGNNLSTMMFSSVMGEAAAKQGGIGLSDMIYKSLQNSENTQLPDELKSGDIYNKLNINTVFGNLDDE